MVASATSRTPREQSTSLRAAGITEATVTLAPAVPCGRDTVYGGVGWGGLVAGFTRALMSLSVTHTHTHQSQKNSIHIPARTSTSMIVTDSISSLPSATGTSTVLLPPMLLPLAPAANARLRLLLPPQRSDSGSGEEDR